MPRNLRSSRKKRKIKVGKPRYWTAEEHERFLEGLARFGRKDSRSIAEYVGTRTSVQVRTHAQKYFIRKEKEEREQSRANNKVTASPELEKIFLTETNFFVPPPLYASFYTDLFPEAEIYPSLYCHESIDSDAERESETSEMYLSPVKFLLLQ